jgi:hypothetical protein
MTSLTLNRSANFSAYVRREKQPHIVDDTVSFGIRVKEGMFLFVKDYT